MADSIDDATLAGELIQASSDFAQTAVGGALALVGGDVGVIAGAAGVAVAAATFRRVGAQLRKRWLDPRQETRVSDAYTLAASEIRDRMQAGESLRDDGFFEAGTDDARTPSEEILEGVLRAAADAHEERKLPYLAHLYAAVAFRDDISLPYANTLIQLAEQCTWRQLVILAFLAPDDLGPVARMRLIVEDDTKPTNEPGDAIWSDCDALGYAGLIGVPQNDGMVAHIAAVLGGGSFRLLDSFRMDLMPPGAMLVELMRLREIPRDDVREVVATLLRSGRPGVIAE